MRNCKCGGIKHGPFCNCEDNIDNMSTGVPRKRELTDAELMSTDDALVWAKEFVRSIDEKGWTIEDIDVGLMLA